MLRSHFYPKRQIIRVRPFQKEFFIKTEIFEEVISFFDILKRLRKSIFDPT